MRGGVIVSAALLALSCGEPSAPPPAAPMAVPPVVTAEPCPEDDYKLTSAPSGPRPDLPPVPDLPDLPEKDGDAFTVYGAVHALRSRYDNAQVTKDEIAIVGFIVDSNLARVPACAWHKTGVADPPSCVTEIPAFVIADAKDTKPDDPDKPHIKVLGWARNFAVLFDATAAYKGLKARPAKLHLDEAWNVNVPFPLPAAGTKVKVKGRLGHLFTKSSTGIVSDPKNGVLTYASLEAIP